MTTTRSAFGAVVFIFLCAMAWIGGDGARATPSPAGWPQRASDHAGHILLAGDNTFSKTGSSANRASGTTVIDPQFRTKKHATHPNDMPNYGIEPRKPKAVEGAAAPRSSNPNQPSSAAGGLAGSVVGNPNPTLKFESAPKGQPNRAAGGLAGSVGNAGNPNPILKFESALSPTQKGKASASRSTPTSTVGTGCKSCRASCSKRWRADCGTAKSCQNQYATCMRVCWDSICQG